MIDEIKALNPREQFLSYERYVSLKSDVIPTGFEVLDKQIEFGGLQQDTLVYIQAKASVGKTYFLTNWIYKMLKSCRPMKVVFFSLEMSFYNVMDRILQLVLQKRRQDIRTIMRDDPQSVMMKLQEMRFFDFVRIWDRPIDLAGMDKIIGEEMAHIVFVDHLHRIKYPSSGIHDKTQNLSNGLVELKKKHKTRIVCAVQIKRLGKEHRNVDAGSEFSMLGDAKGGGEIEEDADIIIALKRPDADADCKIINKRTIHAFIAKNRFSTQNAGVMIWRYNPETSELIEA